MQYPSISSSIQPVIHSDEIAVSISPSFQTVLSTSVIFMCLSTSYDEEEATAREARAADRVSLYSQSELNNLIKDLILPKQSSEMLSSRLQESNFSKSVQMFYFKVTGSEIEKVLPP